MRAAGRPDAFSSLHEARDSGLGRAKSGPTSEQATQQAELPQPLCAQQAQLQQSQRHTSAYIEQDAALAPCLQLHDWDSQPDQQQLQLHGQLLTQPYHHPRQQQPKSSSAGMGVSSAGHPLQLLQALSAATELANHSLSPAALPQQQQQLLAVQLSQQKDNVQPRSAGNKSAASASLHPQQQQQQCEPWQQESIAQRNPFLHAVQQQHLMQDTPSAATTASNVSAFASAAGEGGSVGNRSSSAGGSSGGSSSAGGAGGATVIGRTVTGELPVIPQGYDSVQAAAAAGGSGLAQQPSLSRHNSADMAAAEPGPPTSATAGAQQQHPQQQEEEQFVLRHTRQITCKTYLKRLNVTQYMSDNLLPTMEGSLRVSSQKSQAAMTHVPGSKGPPHRHHALQRSKSAAAAASDDEYDPHNRSAAGAAAAGDHKLSGSGSSGGSQRSYEMMFKVQVKLVDSAGKVWPVTYEGVMCAGQRHLRLTCGWSEVIKAKKIGIGDSITFEQRGGTKTVLAVAIQKAGQEGEEMWAGPLPQDDQIQVLIGSLRSDSAAAPAAAGAGESGAAAKGSGGRANSRAAGSGPTAVAGGGGRGRQPAQHQQVVPGGVSAVRQPPVKRAAQARKSKKRRQRADSDDDDWDDRDFSRSYDEASSGSTAVTDGTAGTNSGSRVNSTAAAASFGPTVQGLQALRVDSAPARMGRSGALAAAAAVAIAAVDGSGAEGSAGAEGSDSLGTHSDRAEGQWQHQPPTRLLRQQSSSAMAAAPAAGPGQSSRYVQESPGCVPLPTQLHQSQHFQRRQRQRQQRDDQGSQLGALGSLGASDQAVGQGLGSKEISEIAVAAIAGSRRLAEWAAANRLAAVESVQSHQLQQQQSQQQFQEEYNRQQQYQEQQFYSSSSAPLGPGIAYSQPMAQHFSQGTTSNPSSSRYGGWQVSTGFVGGAAGPTSIPGNGRPGDVYSSQQQLYPDLQPMPSISMPSGAAVEAVMSAPAEVQTFGGTASRPTTIQHQSLLSQQRLTLNRQASVLSQQALLLSQREGIMVQGGLAPPELAAYGSGVYAPAPGLQYTPQYTPHRQGRSPPNPEPGQTPTAHRSSILDCRSAPLTASAVARTLMMGPPRPQQQQQAGLHVYPSTAELPRGYSLQQQQQHSPDPMLVDSRGSWPVSGSGWQQLQQPVCPPYRIQIEQVLHPDSAWDPRMLHQPAATGAQQQHLLSAYQQVQLQQQGHLSDPHQQPGDVSPYERVQQQQDVSPYEQVQQQQQQHWQEGVEDSPIAPAAPAAQVEPQQVQREASAGQLLESAGMSAEFGSLESIGAMESIELVDTLLQLLENEQAGNQQVQQLVATGAAATPAQQQRQMQEAAIAGSQPNHILQPQSVYQQRPVAPQLQAPQLDQQHSLPPGSSLLQQWLQVQHSTHQSQLAPPTLLPLEAVIQSQQQPGAG